ncbi:MAG: aconitate hydratase [Spirochaetes bacterium]|nr:aconitate hydratase [Spirochaetota bacterium]
MGKTLTQKILEIHIVEGEYRQGSKIGLSVDSILTNDATGILTYLQAEQLEMPISEIENSLCCIDHNNIEANHRIIDDHLFLQTFSNKYGINFSRAGNGVSHQIYLESFAKPGYLVLGTDIHTPYSGAMGMMAFSTGGINAAAALAGLPFYIKVPNVIKIDLKGKLSSLVSAKDAALHILRKNTFLDLESTVFEFAGEGLKKLDIHDRAVIASSAVELGALTSVFPSDKVTQGFLTRQRRGSDFVELKADDDAVYDDVFEVDLSEIVSLAARPHSPLNVVEVNNIEDIYVDQIIIGSCTNSSYKDLWIVSKILEGKLISRSLSLIICPATKEVLSMITREGILMKLIESGARILEPGCGPCNGLGYCPKSKGKSLRTFNRNFKGFSGTKDAEIYLVSPETAAASALSGRIIDPKTVGLKETEPEMAADYLIDDRMIIPPAVNSEAVKIVRGPNIKYLPVFQKHSDNLMGEIILKLPANVEMDDMLPHSIENSSYYSDVYKVSENIFHKFDPDFYNKAKKFENCIIVADENYGQRELYEHYAIALRHLGIFCIISKSFTLNERNTLINFGILPLLFDNKKDYDLIKINTTIILKKVKEVLKREKRIKIDYEKNMIILKTDMDNDELDVVFSGGKMNYLKEKFLKKE